MSGSPLSYWAIMTEFVKPEYKRHVADYLKLVGCTGEEVSMVKRCLKSKSEKDIMGTYLKASTFILSIMQCKLCQCYVLGVENCILITCQPAHEIVVLLP